MKKKKYLAIFMAMSMATATAPVTALADGADTTGTESGTGASESGSGNGAVIYVGKSAYDFGYAIFDQIPVDDEDHGEDVTVVIKDGASVYQIGKILKSKGLIKDAKVFVVQESLSNYKDKLQSGTYILNTSMTTDEMLAVLAREDMTGQPEQDSTDSLDTSADGTDVQTTEESVTDESQDASGEQAGETAE